MSISPITPAKNLEIKSPGVGHRTDPGVDFSRALAEADGKNGASDARAAQEPRGNRRENAEPTQTKSERQPVPGETPKPRERVKSDKPVHTTSEQSVDHGIQATPTADKPAPATDGAHCEKPGDGQSEVSIDVVVEGISEPEEQADAEETTRAASQGVEELAAQAGFDVTRSASKQTARGAETQAMTGISVGDAAAKMEKYEANTKLKVATKSDAVNEEVVSPVAGGDEAERAVAATREPGEHDAGEAKSHHETGDAESAKSGGGRDGGFKLGEGWVKLAEAATRDSAASAATLDPMPAPAMRHDPAGAQRAMDVPRQAPPSEAGDPNVALVSRGLRGVMNQQGGSLTLRLSPTDMGQVRVLMDIRDGVANVRLQAQEESARSLLGGQLGTLREAIEKHGLRVDRLEVQAMPQQNSGSSLMDSRQSFGDRAASDDGRSRGGFDRDGAGAGSHQNRRDSRETPAERFSDLVNALG